MRRLPFDAATFDGIWGCGSFHHVPRAQAAGTLTDVRRVLDDRGVLALTVKQRPTGSETGKRHFEYYEPGAFASLVESAGLTVAVVETGNNWVDIVAEA